MEKQYDPANENNEETVTGAAAEPSATTETTGKPRPVTRRYNRWGRRRGKYAYAAPLGLLISLLSIVGVVALVFAGIAAVRHASVISEEEKESVYYFLEPVLIYTPAPFENTQETEQDAFLNAAAYRVMQAEQIRMLREGDETCIYPVDDNGRIAVPEEEIVASYRTLFGPEAALTNRSIEDSGLEYSQGDACYYVPFETVNSGYRPVIALIQRRSSAYEVRIGYVPNTDVRLDEHGNEIEPTAEQATHFQTYTLSRNEDGSYHILSCTDQ